MYINRRQTYYWHMKQLLVLQPSLQIIQSISCHSLSRIYKPLLGAFPKICCKTFTLRIHILAALQIVFYEPAPAFVSLFQCYLSKSQRPSFRSNYFLPAFQGIYCIFSELGAFRTQARITAMKIVVSIALGVHIAWTMKYAFASFCYFRIYGLYFLIGTV